MKKTKQYISLLLAAFMAAGLSSCIKEDYAGASDETATVNLVFDTRANGDATAQVDENEGIKTMRVYITDEQGNVEFNIYQEYTDDQAQRTLTILGVPVGTKNFYVIANEKSVGLSAEELGEGVVTTINDEFLNQVITNPDGNAYFPKMRNQIGELGLPITGMKTDVVLSEGSDQTIQIDVTHAVAKVVLNIDNQMAETFWVNGVTLGRFISDATYLFPDRDGYYIGENGLRAHTFTATTRGFEVLPGENDAAFVFYIYETGKSAAADDFTIGLSSPTVPEIAAAKQFFTDGRNYLDRNEQLVIDATVNVQQEVTITLRYEVQPWTNASVEVPPFN